MPQEISGEGVPGREVGMDHDFRTAFLSVAFAATVAAAITVASVRGETKETSIDDICATAEWPMIPARCLDGGRGHDVRVVGPRPAGPEVPMAGKELALAEMQARFAVAFN
jgi:hypothetical protein